MTQRGAWTPTKVRERIQTSMLLDRLGNHAVGSIEMTQSQIKAAEILLRKTIPDLKAIEHSGDPQNPVVVKNLSVTFVDSNTAVVPAPVATG